MAIYVGDLVLCRDHGPKVGLVVDKKFANEGMNCSMHTRHLLDHAPSVYYVFFSDEGKTGPYYDSEVTTVSSRLPV